MNTLSLNIRRFSAVMLLAASAAASALPTIDKPAPAFTAVDSNGKSVSLEKFAGKTVVLEWTNDQCPFVRKHYDSGNMQALQKTYTGEDVVWMSVISSAKGKQGYVTGEQANELSKSRGAVPSYVLLDPEGTLGKMYGAKTTPHMYIIDGKGELRYMGAIDSIRSVDPDDIPKATNYVVQAMTELDAGKPVSEPQTRAYGCSIKY